MASQKDEHDGPPAFPKASLMGRAEGRGGRCGTPACTCAVGPCGVFFFFQRPAPRTRGALPAGAPERRPAASGQLKEPLGLPRCTAPFPTKWWLWFNGGRRTLFLPRGRSIARPGRLGPSRGLPTLVFNAEGSSLASRGGDPGQRLLANSLGLGPA